MACQYLQAQGLRLLKRNFRCKCGEIDLIMQIDHTIVFVEVRSRRSARYGTALETVTPAKQRKLIKAAQFFIQRFDPRLQYGYRFDVIAIQGEPGNNSGIQWIDSAF